jgi:hypothetical protein
MFAPYLKYSFISHVKWLFISVLLSSIFVAQASAQNNPAQYTAPVPLPLGTTSQISDPSEGCRLQLNTQSSKCLQISWTDIPGIDGYYRVAIHPNQIFLRTSHDNPNPNWIYWAEPLSDAQYASIAVFLETYKGRVFSHHGLPEFPGYKNYNLLKPQKSPPIPQHRVSDEAQKELNRKAEAAGLHNFQRVLRELNRAITEKEVKFIMPNAIAPTVRIGDFDPLRSIRQSQIDGNVPAPESFATYLKRDLLKYFKGENEFDYHSEIVLTPTSVDYRLLRDAPTQVGMALPKFYAWVKIYEGENLKLEGAIRLAAYEKKGFDILEFYSKSAILSESDAIAKTFPSSLVPMILERAGAKQH